MRALILLLAVIASTPLLTAADAHVHGVVRDSADRHVLSGASVRVVGTTIGTITDRSGAFHLHDLLGDSVVFDVSLIGYRTQRVVVATGRDVRVEVLLPRGYVSFGEVRVEASAPQEGLSTQHARILTAAEIDEHRGQTFVDALTIVPGVTVLQTGPSIAKPVIHGMTGTRLVLRQGGVAQEGQQWGDEHAPEIDPFTASRVSIITGPASVAYGPNALGGVINLDPRPLPQDASWSGEANVNLFTNNWQGAGSLTLERGRLFDSPMAMRAQVSGRRAGSSHTPDYVLDNTGFGEWAGALDVGMATPSWGFTARGSLYRTTLGILSASHIGNQEDFEEAIARGRPDDSASFTYAIDPPKQQIAHTMMVLRGYHAWDDNELSLTYGWQQNDRSEYDAHNTRTPDGKPSGEPAMNLLLTTYSLESKLTHTLAPTLTGTAGAVASRQVNDRSGSVYLVPDYLAWTAGAYLVEEWAADAWTLSGALRYDARWLTSQVRQRSTGKTVEQQRTFTGLTAAFGVERALDSVWNVGANVSSGWRAPQVNELYADDVHHGVATYEIGDSLLTEERSTGVDMHVRYAARGVEAELTAYGHWFDNYILALPDPENPTVTYRGTFPTYRFTSLPARILGADLSVRAAFTDVVSMYATASLVRGTDERHDQPLFMMPSDRARLGVHFHLEDIVTLHDPFLDVSVLGVREQTRYVPGSDYAPPPPGYVRTDAGVGATVHIADAPATFTVTCQNVFNVAYRDYMNRYRYYADDPGRNIIIRFTIPF